ncbi:cytochrome c biogenesis CcdA family protein [Methanocella sp. MCL-LM]|uniref:cytochrome c biogenesis CcdA family protein n=1 Tax=Methanocella sp. MCL-LM TaxID=3412035 RepID=UPI003C709B2D
MARTLVTGVLLTLFLLVATLVYGAGAAPAGTVEVYYVYSHECLSCEQSWPLIKAVLDKAQAEPQISLHKYDINTREGAAFASTRGISTVPAIVFDDGSMILFEDYGNPQAFGKAFSDKLKDRIGHGLPLTVTRKVAESDTPGNTVTVNTCITCTGDRPLKVQVNSTMPERSMLMSGQETWSGVLRPGETHHISSVCEVPPGTRTIPPLAVSYDDGTGTRSMIWPETPVIGLYELSAAAVYLAGLIAGINPCLLAIMVFIGTTAIADTGDRKTVLFRIIAFCGGMLAIYLLIGIGLMELIGRMPVMDIVLRTTIVLLLIALSAWSFFDAWQTARKGEGGRTFKSVLDRIKPLYARFGIAASFAIGGAFGLIKMPCVGGIYIAILGTILESGNAAQGIPLLLIYNLGVVTPVLLLGALITVGLSPAAVNQFRLRHRIGLKIFTGVLLGLMALAFLLGIM